MKKAIENGETPEYTGICVARLAAGEISISLSWKAILILFVLFIFASIQMDVCACERVYFSFIIDAYMHAFIFM